MEVTRAADEESGQNEILIEELLLLRGIAPRQSIDYQGTKRKRVFGPNHPQASRIDISELSRLLQKAFDHKNKKKYEECWLIISLPTCSFRDDIFYKACLAFWDSINQKSGYLKRIFIRSLSKLH